MLVENLNHLCCEVSPDFQIVLRQKCGFHGKKNEMKEKK